MKKPIEKPKKLLFITWDSDRTHYLEGLFFPILEGIQKQEDWDCHVLQFSWAGQEKVLHLARQAEKAGLVYRHYPISRKPHKMLGALWAILKGVRYLKNYILEQDVQLLMPRSTMPAMMVNGLLKRLKVPIKVIFDADGLALEERVDFAGLNDQGLQYKWLKKEELKMLKRADLVLTRSQKAIEVHMENLAPRNHAKFHVVSNGRDPEVFRTNLIQRDRIRKKYGLEAKDQLLVYVGTLGPQYGWEEMLAIFKAYRQDHLQSKMMVISKNLEFLEGKVPAELSDKLILISLSFQEIPEYLSAGDMALNLRLPAPSMRGVAPIKLGEYLLMGLPVISSRGIGDTAAILEGKPFVHLFDHGDPNRIDKTKTWIKSQINPDREAIRSFALSHFTLEKSIADYGLALEKLYGR
ncbi:glycosyltransferase family protein [Pararhodonellum marinum]|uniref:glycosyltransferase n=1 Tax=Pararhodonellum marinum TaxID=2755358 RepID=UPI00188E7699|nr:glycosyltransferase [Pararhodonellum marinum]